MVFTLAIKVKYGDTFRRFVAAANVDSDDDDHENDPDHLAWLRAKICSIFNFPADANLVLKYADEDGDMVTLVDDNDWEAALMQKLKCYRIDVQIINDNAGSTGSATPSRSPPVWKFGYSSPVLGLQQRRPTTLM